MYYLNEDGKRVYTLKVRDDDVNDDDDYRAARFLFLFLSFFAGETCFLSSRILLILSL